MGAPLFFADWRPPEDENKSKYESYVHRVAVIAFNADITEALITHKGALFKVPLKDLTFAKFE